MKNWLALSTLVMSSLAIACGGSGDSSAPESTRQAVTGTVARNLDNARVMAITPTGKTFWAYLDKRGEFTLPIPAGTPFRLIVTNATATGGQKVIGRLAIDTSAGKSSWLLAPNGTLALGTLRPATTTSSGTRTLSERDDRETGGSAKDSEGTHDDDLESHEDEHEDEGVCSVASPEHEDDDDVTLEAEHDPGDKCRDDKEHEHEKEDEADGESDKKPCSGAGGGDGGAPPTTPSTTPPPSPVGGVGVGGTCTVSANCAAGLACVASKCSVR